MTMEMMLQLALFAGVLGAALGSAVWLIRDRARSAQENLLLRREVARLRATLPHSDIKPENIIQGTELVELDSIIYTATQFLEISRPKLERAPATGLISLLRLIFPKKAFDAIFSQIVFDGREEYFEALASGKPGLARWRLVQIYLTVGIAALEWCAVALIQRAVRLWKIGG